MAPLKDRSLPQVTFISLGFLLFILWLRKGEAERNIKPTNGFEDGTPRIGNLPP